MISRLAQWLVTLGAAIIGFALGVNQAPAAVYKTDIGRVRISIRAETPGNLFQVAIPQAHYVRSFHPYRAPLVWKARTISLSQVGRRELEQQGKLGLARIVLQGEDAVVRSAARSFAYGALGATIAALAVAIAFAAIFGGFLSRIIIAVFALLPLLTVGVIAYLVSTRGVTP